MPEFHRGFGHGHGYDVPDYYAAAGPGTDGGYGQSVFQITDPRPPYGPLDAPWDPTEELAFLLQDAMASEQAAGQPPAPPAEPHEAAPDHGSLAGLTRITATLPPIKPAGPGHRKSRSRSLTWPQTASLTLAALAAAIVSMVSVFGGMVTYAPLRHVAEARTHSAVVGWWPLLVYGPWLVASLSVLRAALHQRRAVHSWSVVLLFSTMAILLCVAQAPRTFTDVAAAALPALAALACFQQLVRQITLTRPPRQAAPRHRSTSPPPTGAGRPRPPKPPAAVPGQSRGTGGAGGPER